MNNQQGAALVVGLLLLVVITVLAISGMNTATTELAMARNDQNYENAFQAAETGLETALAQGQFNDVAGAVAVTTTINSYDVVRGERRFRLSLHCHGAGGIPPRAGFDHGSRLDRDAHTGFLYRRPRSPDAVREYGEYYENQDSHFSSHAVLRAHCGRPGRGCFQGL
jgi:hypothetical protein